MTLVLTMAPRAHCELGTEILVSALLLAAPEELPPDAAALLLPQNEHALHQQKPQSKALSDWLHHASHRS